MEFWGVEVKAGKPLKVKPEKGNLIHISQASLDCKGKKAESVLLYVNVQGTKLVIGTLSQETIPQLSFDLVFEQEFELSHNCDKASVHFIGYKSPNIDNQEGDYFSDSEESEEEEVPATVTANGNPGAAAVSVVKADSEPKSKTAEVKPESDDSDEEDESDEDDESDSEEGMDIDEDDSDDDEDSEDEEEETPKKPEPINKKRAIESASKTPVSVKKAKPAAAAVTPQKTDEKKKGGHTATPHPAKKGGKSPVNANQSPKFGGQSFAGSNKKQFNSGKQFGGSNSKGKGKRRA